MKPTDITIDPEFRDLIPPLTTEELTKLEENLSACGLLSPLIVWRHEDKVILVDGHNRLALWKKRNGFSEDFPFLTTEVFLGTRELAIEWIIENQLGRRNLSPDDFKMLLGKLYNSQKKARGSVNQHTVAKDQNDPLQTTAEAIAKQHGVSPATVKRAGKLVEKVQAIQAEEPELPRAQAIKKAKEKPQPVAPAPTEEDEQEALEKLLNIRWQRFLADIPVTSHQAVRAFIKTKLDQPAL